MLNNLEDIEIKLKSLLNNNTDAGGNVFLNNYFPVNICEDEDQEQYFIFIHFVGDTSDTNRNSGQYALTADYDLVCMIAETKRDDLIQRARRLSHEAQQILIQNAETEDYFDLQYVSSSLIKDTDHSMPLIGFKLRFQLGYLADAEC